MSKELATKRLRQLLRNDRLALIRAYADQESTYCFFASMYEVAYHIHSHQLPPRHREAEKEWRQLGADQHGGTVPPEKLFETLLRVADYLNITVEKIVANPSVLTTLLEEKAAEDYKANSQEKLATLANRQVADSDQPRTYRAHAESHIFSNASRIRIIEALKDNWFVVCAIAFSPKRSQANNTLSAVEVVEAIGETIELEPPFILLLLKAMS